MSAYAQHLRPLLRQTLSRSLPGTRANARRIAVLGLPRSGTSWIAKSLSLAPSVTYYFEPDNLAPPEYLYRHLRSDDADPRLKALIGDSFAGRLHDEYVIAEQGLREMLARPFSRVVLVKWVKLVAAGDWILANYPDLTLIQVIRHPVPLALSWRARGWDIERDLDLLLQQPGLRDGVLAGCGRTEHQPGDYWENVGYFWGAITTLQYRTHLRHPDRSVLREHEWYCVDPQTHFRWLFERVGLTYTPEADEFLSENRRRASGPGYGQARDSRQEIFKWRTKISADDLAKLNGVVQTFGLPFYPGLAADAFYTG